MRRTAVAFVAAALALLLGHSAIWFLEAYRVESMVAHWTNPQNASGLIFSHGQIEIGGFPFHIDVAITEPVLATADGRHRWKAPTLQSHALIWRPSHFDYEAVGRFGYRFADDNGLPHEITFDAPIACGTFDIANDQVRSANLRAESIHITGTVPGDIVLGSLEATLRMDPARELDLKSDSASLNLSIHAISLISERVDSALNEPIQSVAVSLGSTGPLPWGGAPDELTRWRDAGGTLELHQVAFVWLGLALDGDGTFALDDQMRPEGALTLRLDGLQTTLQTLTDRGALSPESAELLSNKIKGLGSSDETVPDRLIIGVTAQDGHLTIQDRQYWILAPITGP